MSEHSRSRPGRVAQVSTMQLPQLPQAFWAFHDQYYRPYCRYAHVHLGNRRAASHLVHQVFMHLALHWAHLMEEANPTASAWALLKESVAEELTRHGRRPALTETAVFHRAVRSALESHRQEFELVESALGLYGAIAQLPERQFDVMVLRYVLGFSTAATARIMGVAEATVRSHHHLARRKIARELHIDLDADREE